MEPPPAVEILVDPYAPKKIDSLTKFYAISQRKKTEKESKQKLKDLENQFNSLSSEKQKEWKKKFEMYEIKYEKALKEYKEKNPNARKFSPCEIELIREREKRKKNRETPKRETFRMKIVWPYKLYFKNPEHLKMAEEAYNDDRFQGQYDLVSVKQILWDELEDNIKKDYEEQAAVLNKPIKARAAAWFEGTKREWYANKAKNENNNDDDDDDDDDDDSDDYYYYYDNDNDTENDNENENDNDTEQ